jgi:hypothetical protein
VNPVNPEVLEFLVYPEVLVFLEFLVIQQHKDWSKKPQYQHQQLLK